jgi:polyphenol oxidase
VTPRITHPALAELGGIRHGFFSRAGGASSGIYASLNCGIGSKDDRAVVLENRARAMAALGAAADRLATPYQVHGIDVATVDAPWQPGAGPKADATVTNRPGVVLGVGTADCGPILFADPAAPVIGAAHAGWRGALAGVAGSTVAAMERLGASRKNIVAALGPTISRDNYEVGPEVRDAFLAADPDNARFFTPSPRDGRYQLDLPAFIVADLTATGVSADAIGLCTYADDERFFSYRRATHREEPDYGRLLSAITILE